MTHGAGGDYLPPSSLFSLEKLEAQGEISMHGAALDWGKALVVK